MAVAEAGLQMPQKSTFFFPKVLSGLVLNTLEPVDEVGRVPAPVAASSPGQDRPGAPAEPQPAES
jgi:hypothetical protein